MAKIGPLEFSQIPDFHYGLPFFVIDFVDALTGSKMIKEISLFYKERKLVEVIQQEDPEFPLVRGKI